ncbi:MAG: hypothetical protein HY883_01115 [Deltaproteobacteria bacterium]|nr:hypothetical protein [Deltaproteobacteria bacterium]
MSTKIANGAAKTGTMLAAEVMMAVKRTMALNAGMIRSVVFPAGTMPLISL